MEDRVAIKSGYYFELFSKSEIPEGVVKSNMKVNVNGAIYDLYKGTSIEAEKRIDLIYGDRMGYNIDDYLIKEED